MKKTTLLKKIAFIDAPTVSSGFVPPEGFQLKMMVSLESVSIKVYGFNGASWEQIFETNESDNVFATDINHQKYYFESKTGEGQIVRVSFLSSEDQEDQTHRVGFDKETRKFHDIEEVPMYRSDHQGKFLTVRSDGSLAWLGLNESYVVEVIGADGGGSPETLLWEDKFTLQQDASLYDDGDAGNVMNTGANGYATSNWSDHLTNLNPDQMIVSFWFKCNGSSSGADRKLFGLVDGYKGVVLRASATSDLLTSSYSRSSSDSGLPQKNYNFSSFVGNEWYNVVMILDKVAGIAKTYLNGVMVSERTDIDSSASWVTDGGQFALGSNKLGNDGGATGNSFDFDSFQVTEGFVLTDEQIASIYNDGTNREVVIASDM